MIKYTTADEAVKLIKPGDRVYVHGSTGVPETLVKAMARRGPEIKGTYVYNAFSLGNAEYNKPEWREYFEVNSFFVCENVRQSVKDGCAQYIPSFLGSIPSFFRNGDIALDVVLVNVSLPDEHGYCSLGVSLDLTVAAVECAKTIIAQINPNVPRVFGDGTIHVSRFAACIQADDKLLELSFPPATETDKKIGAFIAEMIPDGATLQIGVGGMPNSVCAGLSNHKHMGIHTEAMTEGVVELIEKGVVDNSQKIICPGVSVSSMALGTKKLYDYMHNNPALLMKDVAWTNDPWIIRQNPKVMSINSALEVDMTGQICSDSIGTSIFSGFGGQHDFVYGATLSAGGKSFIALPSVTTKGISKITSVLTPGAGVVTTRAQAMYIVTEYGVASLRAKNLAERACEMIKIAHPSAREELEREAVARYGKGFLKLR